MAYLASYRKYRPKTFADIIGQEHITTTLKNQMKTGQISHAYLFCGIRGTGKTSAAKVFAKALNCFAPIGQEPCGVCAACAANESDAMPDTIEIDAASNRGIEEIRQIKESVKYPPAMGAYKIYIIDEVHMLTMEAFNALLKTLEEPPENVIFILATTESHRLPYTIISRTQRYDFRRLSTQAIVGQIEKICQNEQIAIEGAAAERIALLAEGALRDALSLLDKCAAYASEETITSAVVDTVTGRTDEEAILQMVEALFYGQTEALFTLVQTTFDNGSDAATLLSGMLGCVRDIIISQLPADTRAASLRDESTSARMKALAQTISLQELTRAFDILLNAQNKIPFSPVPRYGLECGLLKILQKQSVEAPAPKAAEPTAQQTSAAPVPPHLPVVHNAPAEIKDSSAPHAPREVKKPAASERKEEKKKTGAATDTQALKKKIVASLSKTSPFIALGVENADIVMEENRLTLLLSPNDYRLIGDDVRFRQDVVLAAKEQFAKEESIEVEIKLKEKSAEEEFRDIIGDILIIEE